VPARPGGWPYHTTTNPNGRGPDSLAHRTPTLPPVFHPGIPTRPALGTTTDAPLGWGGAGSRTAHRDPLHPGRRLG